MTRETQIFEKTFLHWNPSASVPPIEIRYYPYASVMHTIRLRRDVIKVRLSHLFRGAPGPVIESVAHILFAKLYRHQTPRAALDRYHHFVEANQERFRKVLGDRHPRSAGCHHPQGRYHDLEKSFQRVNHRYFHPPLRRPILAWTRRGGNSKLAEYLCLRNTITINRRFDSAGTPSFVIDYLMFHEMLHMKHRAQIRNGRRVVHTRQFRQDEAGFEGFAAAQQWIRATLHQRVGWHVSQEY